jgi:hypothetical protein
MVAFLCGVGVSGPRWLGTLLWPPSTLQVSGFGCCAAVADVQPPRGVLLISRMCLQLCCHCCRMYDRVVMCSLWCAVVCCLRCMSLRACSCAVITHVCTTTVSRAAACFLLLVPAAVLCGLEELSASLEVSLSDVLNLVTQQPTLLLAKVSKLALCVMLLGCLVASSVCYCLHAEVTVSRSVAMKSGPLDVLSAMQKYGCFLTLVEHVTLVSITVCAPPTHHCFTPSPPPPLHPQPPAILGSLDMLSAAPSACQESLFASSMASYLAHPCRCATVTHPCPDKNTQLHILPPCSAPPAHQPPAILGSLDVLSAALKLTSPSQALALLVSCPQLLYDITIPALQARLEQLAVVLACSSEEARQAALQQPVCVCLGGLGGTFVWGWEEG